MNQIFQEFVSTTCFCGEPKKKNQSFCRACYCYLPILMRSALYKRFGSGYEEAHQVAKDFLGKKLMDEIRSCK